ncbi:MAG TPA: DNA polymerase ligase N-terminal domain-containing protein [Bryobacteraceae bacterium]|jgi:bifunctional non-homologous end joining protein LigD|nr:DNA polymerase ligase N-terminal domain-containing protein [Bryobacteraceae bacterium]
MSKAGDSLKKYRSKRNFDVTSEPSGGERKRSSPTRGSTKKALAYVIQKHQASHLHYDFRLEWNGVLLSWAIPKGPSLDPSVKRLAAQVEDHPLEYGGFEGVIPEGEYGGGTVMLWDKGTWTPEIPDVDAALGKGELKFNLNGKKLKGSWVLIRTKGGFGGSRKPQWLLIKHRDQYASTEDVLATKPRSVLSNRRMAEIARDGDGDVAKAARADPLGSRETAGSRTRAGSRARAS